MAFDIGLFSDDSVLWELPGLRHCPARTFVLPLVCTCRLRSFRGCHRRSLFALFRLVAMAIVPALSPLSVIHGQINAEAVLHVSKTKGGARVPGSHLITHLFVSTLRKQLSRPSAFKVLFLTYVRHVSCIAAGGSWGAKTSTKIMTWRNFPVATVAHKYDTRRKKLSRLSSRGIRSRVY